MAVMRGPDGKIINPKEGGQENTEETRRVPRRSMRLKDQEDAEPRRTAPAHGADDEPTAGKRRDPGAAPTAPGRREEAKTTIYRGQSAGAAAGKEAGAEAAGGQADDPVVGWVVVVDGPGRGASVPLGYGMNSVGRAKTERVCLPFGDEQISRSQHAVITYDPRGRKFFVQHGGGKNLTYIGSDEPVLVPTQLKGGEDITMGKTRLRFVPFCGVHFDWQDQSDQ